MAELKRTGTSWSSGHKQTLTISLLLTPKIIPDKCEFNIKIENTGLKCEQYNSEAFQVNH